MEKETVPAIVPETTSAVVPVITKQQINSIQNTTESNPQQINTTDPVYYPDMCCVPNQIVNGRQHIFGVPMISKAEQQDLIAIALLGKRTSRFLDNNYGANPEETCAQCGDQSAYRYCESCLAEKLTSKRIKSPFIAVTLHFYSDKPRAITDARSVERIKVKFVKQGLKIIYGNRGEWITENYEYSVNNTEVSFKIHDECFIGRRALSGAFRGMFVGRLVCLNVINGRGCEGLKALVENRHDFLNFEHQCVLPGHPGWMLSNEDKSHTRCGDVMINAFCEACYDKRSKTDKD